MSRRIRDLEYLGSSKERAIDRFREIYEKFEREKYGIND